jgi:hypothetical protein
MPHYRKKRSTDTWHWCKNCPGWPISSYEEEWHSDTERPAVGELCNQCKSKEKANDCTT